MTRATAAQTLPMQPLPHRVSFGAIVLLAATCALSACAPQARQAGTPSGPMLGSTARVSTGSVKADLNVVGDATQILRESSDENLAAAGIACSPGSSGCASLDLHAALREPAAAFRSTYPPLRIAELVASYREPGAGRASSRLVYQRSVAASGNLSTATWMRVSDALARDLAADIDFRAKRSGIVVRLPSWAASDTTLVRTSKPGAFHVPITSDGRSDADTIGTVGARPVRLARRATDYLTELLTDELRGAGHTIVPAMDGRLVGSELEKFWVSTAQSSKGWTTTADIDLDLEVAPPKGVKRKKANRHTCHAVEVTAHVPAEADIARALQRCLSQLVGSMRGDEAWSR